MVKPQNLEMPFALGDLTASQFRIREFFAIWPRLTIHGWAWLTDLREVATVNYQEASVRIHFEKIYHAG